MMTQVRLCKEHTSKFQIWIQFPHTDKYTAGAEVSLKGACFEKAEFRQ